LIQRNSPRPVGYAADRRLYLDKTGAVVEADDPARVELLAPAGGTIPMPRAVALGLVPDENNAVETDDKDPKPKTATKTPQNTK